VAVDRDTVESEAEEGSTRAAATLAALRTLSFQLSGAQLGITVTSLLVGFLIEPAVSPLLRPAINLFGLAPETSLAISITVGLLLATVFEMVGAELVPKNLAIARPVRVAYRTAAPLRLVNSLFRPVIVFLNSAANWTVRMIGIEPREELMPVRSLSELELLIRSSREAGTLLEEEYALLSRSITFARRTASEALVPRTSIIALNKDQTCADMAEAALDSGHSRFPVYDEDLDDTVGVAHVKDSYRIGLSDRASTPVSEIMRPPMVVPESRGLESLLLEMRRARQQLAIVADEYGGTAGLITLEDLLEEIVGEIEDEHDPAAAQPDPTAELQGVHVISGLLHLGEVEDITGLEIPEGPYDTLAGFLLWLLDRLPRPGDHISYKGWEFKVVEMDRYRIEKVLVCAPGGGSTDR
jgi:CBS domain containing-hemolysin-like protein